MIMQASPEIRNILLSDKISGLKIEQALLHLTGLFPNQVVFSTSFSMEDQVITDIILTGHIPVSIFTLDTGRHFAETYVSEKGPNAFYKSISDRIACCHIRKVEPLQRALKGQSVWITGLRAAHSIERERSG